MQVQLNRCSKQNYQHSRPKMKELEMPTEQEELSVKTTQSTSQQKFNNKQIITRAINFVPVL